MPSGSFARGNRPTFKQSLGAPYSETLRYFCLGKLASERSPRQAGRMFLGSVSWMGGRSGRERITATHGYHHKNKKQNHCGGIPCIPPRYNVCSQPQNIQSVLFHRFVRLTDIWEYMLTFSGRWGLVAPRRRLSGTSNALQHVST